MAGNTYRLTELVPDRPGLVDYIRYATDKMIEQMGIKLMSDVLASKTPMTVQAKLTKDTDYASTYPVAQKRLTMDVETRPVTTMQVTCPVTWMSGTTAAATTTASYSDLQWMSVYRGDGRVRLESGQSYDLPDGSRLIIDAKGNYRIEDKAAKVTYRANRIRDFSPHLNASDMLAKFVSYVGTLGLKRAEVLGLPIHLFISWLVIEAAERDGDPLPADIVPVQDDPVLKAMFAPQCLACGRFIKHLHHRNRFPFCSPEHGAKYLSRLPQVPQLAIPDLQTVSL